MRRSDRPPTSVERQDANSKTPPTEGANCVRILLIFLGSINWAYLLLGPGFGTPNAYLGLPGAARSQNVVLIPDTSKT